MKNPVLSRPVIVAILAIALTIFYMYQTRKKKQRSSAPPISADTGIDVEKVAEWRPYKDWLATVQKEKRVNVLKVHVQSIDYFGKNIGFIKFKASVTVDGREVPGIVFMRGGSVAILVILHHESRRFALVVRQPRVPVSLGDMVEIPAGMLDGDGNFAGVAAKEMAEETGIRIKSSDLIDMTQSIYRDRFPGIFPSCGGSDEFNRIFLFEKAVSREELESLNGKLTGVAEEGEMIKLQIVPLESLWRMSPDAKALAALTLYERGNFGPVVPVAQSKIKHAYFDFDQTISRTHVWKVLAMKEGARCETGQVHKLQELDATGKKWQFNMQKRELVEHAQGDRWSIASLGGPDRVKLLRKLFETLREAGAKLTVITKGNVGVIRYILTQADLLSFFETVYGCTYEPSEYDLAHAEPTGYEGKAHNVLKSSKAHLISNLMEQNGARFDEAVLVEDDKNEADSVGSFCKSVWVSEMMGMTPFDMNTILELAGLPALKVPAK